MKFATIFFYPIFVSSFTLNLKPCLSTFKSVGKDTGIERELDTFFEKVAAAGAKSSKKYL